MKKQLLSLTFSAMVLISTNLSNATELKSIKDATAPLKLKKTTVMRGDNGDGIKGKTIVTGGVGFNTTRIALLARYGLHDANNNSTPTNGFYSPIITSSSQTPIICLGVDYGLLKRFSVGAAFGYQSIKLNANAQSNGIAGTDTWTRIQAAIRGDYYIVANDNVSLYTGLKLGYNMYNVSSTYTSINSHYISDLKATVGNPVATSVQAHFGFSYFVGGMVGFNTELALGVGGPYYFAAGLTFKM
jgi:hypothetical protein